MVEAETFEQACEIAIKGSKDWLKVDGPFHDNPKDAWAAYKQHWEKVGIPESGHDEREDRDQLVYEQFIASEARSPA